MTSLSLKAAFYFKLELEIVQSTFNTRLYLLYKESICVFYNKLSMKQYLLSDFFGLSTDV